MMVRNLLPQWQQKIHLFHKAQFLIRGAMESQSFIQTNEEEKPQKPRKKYEKPAVIYLAPLEAMAGGCEINAAPYKSNPSMQCISTRS
jgi:hypothetical protein